MPDILMTLVACNMSIRRCALLARSMSVMVKRVYCQLPVSSLDKKETSHAQGQYLSSLQAARLFMDCIQRIHV